MTVRAEGCHLLQPFVSYAQALAAADHKSAVAEFRRWAEGNSDVKPREVEVAAAGLSLLAGEPEAAHRVEIELRQSSDVRAPVWTGELGWWHYLDGDYRNAVDLLSEAQQQRPTELNLRLRLAWALIEVRRYGDALQTLEGAAYEQNIQPARAIIRAVAHWQAQEHDQALLDLSVAVNGQPEWENLNWVKALYSPLVAQSVQEMQAERERRKQKAKAAASR